MALSGVCSLSEEMNPHLGKMFGIGHCCLPSHSCSQCTILPSTCAGTVAMTANCPPCLWDPLWSPFFPRELSLTQSSACALPPWWPAVRHWPAFLCGSLEHSPGIFPGFVQLRGCIFQEAFPETSGSLDEHFAQYAVACPLFVSSWIIRSKGSIWVMSPLIFWPVVQYLTCTGCSINVCLLLMWVIIEYIGVPGETQALLWRWDALSLKT